MDSNQIRQEFDLIIVAIKRPDGNWIYNPPLQKPIQVGDTVIAIGLQGNMEKFHKYLYGTPRIASNNSV